MLRRTTVSANEAVRRGLGGWYFADETRSEHLVLVRAKSRSPHFRRLPRAASNDRRCAPAGAETPHAKAVRRVWLEIAAGEGLTCRFHDGVGWTSEPLRLVLPAANVDVVAERSCRLDGQRLVPDLLVRCRSTGALLLAIEICASHPVGEAKRRAYAAAALPWIEIRVLNTLNRFRKMPLCAQDWDGPGFPSPPHQATLVN